MPVVVVNLSIKTFAAISGLVESGRYSSPADFLELAAANQLELEKQHRGGPRLAEKSISSRSRGRPAKRSPRQAPSTRVGARPRSNGPGPLPEVEVADAMARLALTRLETVPKPPVREASIPEGWIWGQVNRILPLKLALRWIASRAITVGKWESITTLLEPLGADAATIGSALEAADADADRSRDELLATGLPRRGNTLSEDRFLSQYLARTTRKGETHPGAAVQYGLAAIGADEYALTAVGLEFAELRNPVIDGGIDSATETLSVAEREFFVRRVVPAVSGELDDYEIILGLIVDGKNTPTDQIEKLSTTLPRDWSETMIRTHVTGVVARMVDLGLLRRQWQGRHVLYETTELAAQLHAR